MGQGRRTAAHAGSDEAGTSVLAPTDGVVAELPVPAGGQVQTGAVLAVVNPEEDPDDLRSHPEQDQLRDAVRALGRRYGHGYFVEKAKAGEHTTELWADAGRLGYLGSTSPPSTAVGAGHHRVGDRLRGVGRGRLPVAAAGGLPAIAATVLTRHGTEEQRKRHLPGLADGSQKIVFAITEPEAGSNFHRLGTVARRDGDGWLLNGRKCYISGVDEADHVLVVARTEDSSTGKLKPALFLVPTDAAGLTRSKLDMEIVSPENQFLLYLDDVRVPADALLGESLETGLPALFAGLNPERITVAAMGAGTGRYAIERASEYTATRKVWGGRSIGSHQGCRIRWRTQRCRWSWPDS
ncbi:acyl-CoA dehydrogenase family protein [Micromonospora sp. M12]